MHLKRIYRILFALIIVLLMPNAIFAQDDVDASAWAIISVKKPLKHDWIALLRSEIHTKDHTSDMDYWYIAAGTGHKFNNWLRTDFGLIYVGYHGPASSTNSAYWRPIYRTYLSFSENKKVGPIRGTLREYWGYCWMPETTVEGNYKKGSAYHEFRLRLRLDYIIDHSKFTPYAYVEEWNKSKLERIRYVGGVDYKMNKHNTIGAFYMWQDKYHSIDTHVFGIEYSLLL